MVSSWDRVPIQLFFFPAIVPKSLLGRNVERPDGACFHLPAPALAARAAR